MLSWEDWARFEKTFPAAAAWITERQLRSELAYLLRLQVRTTHQAGRLTELQTLFSEIDARKTA